MFTDLLDQPRRELEAVRAQCAALQLECAEQKGRVQELTMQLSEYRDTFADKLAEQKGRFQELTMQLSEYRDTFADKLAEQKGRVQELTMQLSEYRDTFADKLAEQEAQIDVLKIQTNKQKAINLSLSLAFGNPNFKPPVVREGLIIEEFYVYNKVLNSFKPSKQNLQFKSYFSCFENGVWAGQNIGRAAIRGVGDPVEIFMFQHDPDIVSMLKYQPDFSAPRMKDWKPWLDTPIEFVEGFPMKVYRRCVEGFEAQLSIDLPDALFYIFKCI
jgi:hypothetical protein